MCGRMRACFWWSHLLAEKDVWEGCGIDVPPAILAPDGMEAGVWRLEGRPITGGATAAGSWEAPDVGPFRVTPDKAAPPANERNWFNESSTEGGRVDAYGGAPRRAEVEADGMPPRWDCCCETDGKTTPEDKVATEDAEVEAGHEAEARDDGMESDCWMLVPVPTPIRGEWCGLKAWQHEHDSFALYLPSDSRYEKFGLPL